MESPETRDATEFRRRRLTNGDTQRALALLCGVTERTIVRWEQGEGLPDAKSLILLADRWGCEPRDLVGLESDEIPA